MRYIDSILFLGTAPFAVPSLELLHTERFNLIGAVTRPDRPAGRGRQLKPSPVKESALKLGLSVYEPENKSELDDLIARLNPRLVVNVAYGMFLSRKALSIPDLGSVNLHPSLLPLYRGAAPIQRTLMAGDTKTGVTVIYMALKMDAGEIILQETVDISPGEDFGSLYERLSRSGALKLVEALDFVIRGEAEPVPQLECEATFAPPISGNDEKIDWSTGAVEILNQIRALSPQPGAYTFLGNKRLKVWRATASQISQIGGKPPGTICSVGTDSFSVLTGEGALQVLELQAEGKKRIKTAEFLKGCKLKPGERFL